jgi:hypothetical protein
MPFEYENEGAPDGRQPGTYRGIMSSVHCHFVGGNDHLQIGNDRYNIRWAHNADKKNPAKVAEIDRLREAWEALKLKGDATAGVADCKRWLKSYLIDYHKVNSSKIT